MYNCYILLVHICRNRRTLCCSDTNRLLTSWIRFFDTRRKTQFLKVFRNHTMLTTPPTFGTSRGPISISLHPVRTHILNIMVGPQLLNIMVGPQLLNIMVDPTSQLHGRNSTKSFSKILQILSPSLPGMTSSTFQPHFLLGLLWKWWLSYPLRTSVNCTNWLHTWTLNPHSSKPNQTEW